MAYTLKQRVVGFLVALALALGFIVVQGVSSTSHYDAADASWIACHAAQSLHELSNPPASWPGTRAAHQVFYYSNLSDQYFYTKSGWWDPTWDFYKNEFYLC